MKKLLLVLVMLLTACSVISTPAPTATPLPTATPMPTTTPVPTVDPCSMDDVVVTYNMLMDIFSRWDDAINTTSVTPRVSLYTQIPILQSLRDETKAVPMPICLSGAREHLINYMNGMINAIVYFAQGKDDQVVKDIVAQAKAEFDLFIKDFKAILPSSGFSV